MNTCGFYKKFLLCPDSPFFFLEEKNPKLLNNSYTLVCPDGNFFCLTDGAGNFVHIVYKQKNASLHLLD